MLEMAEIAYGTAGIVLETGQLVLETALGTQNVVEMVLEVQTGEIDRYG